ncbi:hypothetical protein ACFPPD_06480 [Cohnella suwonensis]|uniref:Spore germination protein n=1 Tax=Cohnella suwonensis TaxID=696072 RepID=A0ABW0LR34_9BACL
MSRYFHYHVIYVGMINIMLFVPWILIQHRFHGSIASIALVIPLCTLGAYVAIALFGRFPGMGLPEILLGNMPRWLSLPLLFFTAFFWFVAGMLVIYSYSATIQQFFNPDMNPYLFTGLMIAASIWGASRCTRSVQFAMEIILILSAPLIIAILLKALFNKWLDWDAIRVVAGYVRTKPSFISFSAASLVFAGHNTLVVFNRMMPAPSRIRRRWIIPLFCTFFLLVSVFIPIGFHGTVGVSHYIYLWSVTADSMVLEYGFVSRVLYIFLLLYTALSLLFAMNTWHTAMEVVKSMRPGHKPLTEEFPVKPANWWINVVFGAMTIAYGIWANERRNEWVSHGWLNVRLLSDVLTVSLLALFVFRASRSGHRNGKSGGDGATADS